MPWDIFWTMILQLGLALAVLALPMAVFILVVGAAVRTALRDRADRLDHPELQKQAIKQGHGTRRVL